MNSLSILDSYDGLTNPCEFERLYSQQAALFGWDDTKQLAHMPLFLVGKAKRVYDAITDKTTLAKAFEGIRKGCAQSKDVLLQDFFQRRRGQSETLTQYASALHGLLNAAAPGMDSSHPGSSAPGTVTH